MQVGMIRCVVPTGEHNRIEILVVLVMGPTIGNTGIIPLTKYKTLLVSISTS
jgi:hypothetical protein